MTNKTILERAFELARAGKSVDDIRRQLSAEQYSNVEAHLAGGMIKKQLRNAMRGTQA